jgi:hypothetical protein
VHDAGAQKDHRGSEDGDDDVLPHVAPDNRRRGRVCLAAVVPIDRVRERPKRDPRHFADADILPVGSGNSGRWIPEILAPSPETLAV